LPATLYLSPNLDTSFSHAARAVAELRQEQPFAPLSFLLPDSAAAQAARQRLGDTIGVKFSQFYGLGQAILDAAHQPVYQISDTAQRRLVRQILGQMAAEGRLTSFLPVWEMPGFVQVLVEWLHEMKSQGIAPEAVEAHAQTSTQERDRQLAGFYTAYQDYLIRRRCSDIDGLLWLAAEALEGQPDLPLQQHAFFSLGFDQFNPLQVRILRAFAPRCADFRVYMPWDVKRPAGSLALTRLAQTRRILEEALHLQVETLSAPRPVSPVLAQIQAGIFEPGEKPRKPLPDTAGLRLVAASSREAEARWALKSMKQRLLEGAAPDQVALLAPDPEVYQRIVEIAAEEYGIPVRLERRLDENPAIAALLNLLSLAPRFPWRETLDALRSPYFSQPWLSAE
jgi:ATP-dependent helicase/DNAse subunit B